MAELPHDQSPERSQFDFHESRDDNLAEIISQIDECFEQIVLQSKTTTYIREQKIRSDSDFALQIEPIPLTMSSKGSLETGTDMRIETRLPAIVASSDALHESRYGVDPFLSITKDEDGKVRAVFTPNTETPKGLLEPLLARDGLPDSLMHVIQEIASTLIRDRQYNDPAFRGVVGITVEQFDDIWETVLKDTEEVPTEVLWMRGFMNGDGRLSSVLTINTHLPLDIEHPVECVELKTGEFDYVVETDKKGSRVHTFEETIADEDLPELTDDQRTGNPYMIVPMDALQHPERGKGIVVMDSEDNFAVRQPMTGHAVIHPEQGVTPYKVLGDANDAQAYADLLHRRDIAKSLQSKEMTVERARRVLATVREVMTHPDLLNNLKRKEP